MFIMFWEFHTRKSSFRITENGVYKNDLHLILANFPSSHSPIFLFIIQYIHIYILSKALYFEFSIFYKVNAVQYNKNV